jgi:hypothetical protein
MRIFILKTGLFAEEGMLKQAIACFEPEHQVELFDATRPNLEENDWDTAVKWIEAADRVISI